MLSGRRGAAVADLTGLRVEEELGRGATTSVHRIRRAGRSYAMKQLRLDDLDQSETAVAFCREAALLAIVDHPGVIRTHAAGYVDGRAVLVTEYIDGHTLADELVNGPLPQHRVIQLAGHLADALTATHRTGLVHRDIKPHNIMVLEGGSTKLIDFGLAVLGYTPVDADAAVGTFVYTAPEQSGMLKRPVDGRADLYSLGATLFECLTGAPPFVCGDVGELLRMHAAAPVPDVRTLCPDVDPVLAAIITRLLAKDPDDRHSSATALRAELAGCVGAESSPADKPMDWPLCGRAHERRALMERWQRARAGQGGAVVVRGPAGGGRSRLAAEVAAAAQVDSALVLRAAGSDEALPLAALRTAFEHHVEQVRALPADERAGAEQRIRQAAGTASIALIRTLSPALAGLLSDLPGTSVDGRGDRLFSAVAVFLSDLAVRSGGAILELDDAHRLDPSTRRVLALLAPDLVNVPLLVVVAEAETADRPLIELGAAVDTVLSVGPLTIDGTAALVGSRLPGAGVTPELVSHVAVRTGGLPMAIVEYLYRAVDAGLLVPLWGTWHLDETGLDAIAVSPDALGVMVSRLEGLSAPDRDVLVAAAVIGSRFSLALVIAACASGPEQVVTALAAAVARRLVEQRDGGGYGFVHSSVRDVLLADADAERLQHLHRIVAATLEENAPRHRDPLHVYAVARHYVAAGTMADPAATYRSTLAAGGQALDDQTPADAVMFLEQAVDAAAAGGRQPTTEVLHPLALGYFNARRMAEAQATLDRALATEGSPGRRAALRATSIEIHHTMFAIDRALDETTAALADLGHPLPGNKVLLVATTMASALAGVFVQRLRIGFGTAAGPRRQELTALASILDAGAYAAAVGMRVPDTAVLALRALYSVNRLGPSPQYARTHATLGNLAAALKQRRKAQRSFARAADAAHRVADPVLIAYVDWMRGLGMVLGGLDDGTTWETAITRHARWLVPAHFIAGTASTAFRLSERGYCHEALAAYQRGVAKLPDPAMADGTVLALPQVTALAQLGRHAEASAAVNTMRTRCGDGTLVQRTNIVVAGLCVLTEQGEFGQPFEDLVAEFEALRFRRIDLNAAFRWFYAYRVQGRLAQLRRASEQDRPARLAAAQLAISQLRRVASTPMLKAAHTLRPHLVWGLL
jgi:tRNA A-37 threonylcarbamoyl transferase component Bud32